MPLHNGYGVTECSPTIAQTRVESPRNDTSIGPPFPGVEIKLVGADRKPVAQGEAGELWVRGPNVMKGYYRAPEETAAAIDPRRMVQYSRPCPAGRRKSVHRRTHEGFDRPPRIQRLSRPKLKPC